MDNKKHIMNLESFRDMLHIYPRVPAPKPKASVRRARSSSNTSITPPTAAASPRLTASAKGKQTAKASKAKSLSGLSKVAMSADEGTGSIPGVLAVPIDESEEELFWKSMNDEGDDTEEKDDDCDEKDEGDDAEETKTK
nr:hypothetical protein [Tanacetum cinerariifolium]